MEIAHRSAPSLARHIARVDGTTNVVITMDFPKERDGSRTEQAESSKALHQCYAIDRCPAGALDHLYGDQSHQAKKVRGENSRKVTADGSRDCDRKRFAGRDSQSGRRLQVEPA